MSTAMYIHQLLVRRSSVYVIILNNEKNFSCSIIIISYEHPSLELGILFSHSYPPLNNYCVCMLYICI